MPRIVYNVCPKCEGHGKIVNPSCSVWTEDMIDEYPDSFRAMLGGVYDIRCPMCAGIRVVSDDQIHEYMDRMDDAREAYKEDHYGSTFGFAE